MRILFRENEKEEVGEKEAQAERERICVYRKARIPKRL